MKKLFSIVLSVLLILSLAACAKKDDTGTDNSSMKYDIAAFLSYGKVPETDFRLKSSIDEIKNKYTESVEGELSDELYITSDDTRICLAATDEMSYYYFDAANQQAGAQAIFCFDVAYGIQVGEADENELKLAYSGITFSEREVSQEELYFSPTEMEGVKSLYYESGEFRADFYFSEGILFAVGISVIKQ